MSSRAWQSGRACALLPPRAAVAAGGMPVCEGEAAPAGETGQGGDIAEAARGLKGGADGDSRGLTSAARRVGA